MPAPVINGLFTSNVITWQSAIATGTYAGYCAVANPLPTSVTLSGAILNGPFPFNGDYAIPGGQIGSVLNPGQSVIIQVNFIPTGAGLRTGQLQVAFTQVGGSGIGFATIALLGTQAGNNVNQPFPDLIFPTTKIAASTTFANMIIVNTSQVNLNVTTLAMQVGTDFFLVGAPIVPFTINVGAASAPFSVQFTPTAAGSRNDQVVVTSTGGFTGTCGVSGIGSVLQSAFSLTGATQGTLFGVVGLGGGPQILLASPTSLNSEEPGSFVKLHDFQLPNQEKQLMRIRGHYEDLGVATVTFTVRSRRQGQPDEIIPVNVVIGSVAADGWIREFTSEPTPVSGELIQITCSRLANGGPVSLIDYMPQFELKGEVIGGT